MLETDADDRNGHESFVHEMIMEGRVDWLPLSRSASLEEEKKGGADDGDKEEEEEGTSEQGGAGYTELLQRIEKLEADTQDGIKRIMAQLQQQAQHKQQPAQAQE